MHALKLNMWHDISTRTYSYMMRSNVNDDWFGTRSFYSDPDHERHGFELRPIEMNESFDGERSRYRNEQWNRFLDKANNVLAYVLLRTTYQSKTTILKSSFFFGIFGIPKWNPRIPKWNPTQWNALVIGYTCLQIVHHT